MMATKKNIFGWIPNFLTSLNLVSGSVAVIFGIDGHLSLAGIFILIAALFDFLDGMTARLLKAYSPIGKELDSLADVISFGLAPAAILFTLYEYTLFGKNQHIQDIEGSLTDWLILFSSFLIPVFSALRLAKFNVSTEQERNFVGLPTPANAILWASLGLMLSFPGHTDLLRMLYSTKNFLIIVIVTSLLLVSEIPMFSLKFKSFLWSENRHRYIFIFLCIILLVFLQVYAIPILIFLYILFNMALYLLKIEL